MRVRAALATVSLALVGAGFFARSLGLSASAGITAGKVVLVSLGVLGVAVALLGKRTVRVYKATAIMLLNTIVLLALLEAGLFSLSRLRDFLPSRPTDGAPQPDLRFVDDGRERLPYYVNQDWAQRYWLEYHFLYEHLIKYQPFTVWRTAAFQGETINIDEEGHREVPDTICGEGSLVVFVFGGSTMWGTGVPDWGTIPAYLQQELRSSSTRPVCIVNYGEQGYVSTQSTIQLVLALQQGRLPDVVVFYDGTNDVFAAYQSARAGVHQNLSQIAARYEDRDEISPAIRLLAMTRTFTLLQRWTKRRGAATTDATFGGNGNKLANSVAQIYLGNYEIVGALAVAFNFRFHFFWQSNLFTDRKPLTAEEAGIRQVAVGVYPDLAEFYVSTRQIIEQAAGKRRYLHKFDQVFANQPSQIYIDPWHVTMDGNQLVAQAMLKEMADIR